MIGTEYGPHTFHIVEDLLVTMKVEFHLCSQTDAFLDMILLQPGNELLSF
jgi:hypothetical protein